MSFGEAIASYWKNYVNFKGRARRSEYWYAVLFLAIAVIGLTIIDSVLFTDIVIDAGVGPLTSIFYLAIILPGIALVVRRLHDVSKSGWWYLLGLIPFVGGIVLLIFALQDSTPGPNQYGPSPKGDFSPAPQMMTPAPQLAGFCTSCGASLQPSSAFCVSCGSPVQQMN